MSKATEGLQPVLLWKYFAAISAIPRGSGNEAAISKYVVDQAKRLGLSATTDKLGNVVVKKPASPGREHARSVILQGHMDMVCVKNKDKVHDFKKDPIEIVRHDNVLMANGTTLGGDNGVAVSTNLAIMEDRSLEHGPLEFLFTVDEEEGLTGASSVSADFFGSMTMINLDTEEEGAVYVGCSGGRSTIGKWKVAFDAAPAQSVPLLVKVSGLRGGHSGLEIDKGRGNAVRILARVAMALTAQGARLSRLDGGNKHNAIPREAEALFFVRKKDLEGALSLVRDWQEIVKVELASVDPEVRVEGMEAKVEKRRKVLRKKKQKKLLQVLSALPHGVIRMSADIPGLVETSTNLAIVACTKDSMAVTTSQRSSVASSLREIADAVVTVFDLAGASVEIVGAYPGWKPNLDSEILKVARSTYQSLYGKEPAVKAIHAGLETGIIGEKRPGMDMISIGPTLEGVHSPEEKIYIDTVEKYWNLLINILKNVK